MTTAVNSSPFDPKASRLAAVALRDSEMVYIESQREFFVPERLKVLYGTAVP